MENDIKLLTDKALKIACAQDEVRLAMTRPYNMEKTTYATCGRIVLGIPTEICNQYEAFEGCKFPNVEAIINEFPDRVDAVLRTEDLKPKLDVFKHVKIGDMFFYRHNIDRAYDILRLLGVETVNVTFSKYLMLRFGDMLMILCNLNNSDGELDYSMHYIVSLHDASLGVHMDIDAGFPYLATIQEKEEVEKKRQAELPRIYTFSIVRSATMYVSAHSKEEARKIARQHVDDIDVDDFDCPEIDSMDTYTDIEADDTMDTIYTKDEEFTADEYNEWLNEQ